MKASTKLMVRAAVITLLSAVSFSAKAQFYLGVQSGYGFGTAQQGNEMLVNYTVISTSTSSIRTTEPQSFSLGAGLNFGINAGYFINHSLGLELGFSYLTGNRFESLENYTVETFNGLIESNSTNTISANMLRFTPSIVLRTELGKMQPYARFGLVMGFGSILLESSFMSIETVAGNEERYASSSSLKLSEGISWGISSGLGVRFPLNDKLHLFGEANLINQTYAPKRGELTSLIENGSDQLDSQKPYWREFEFLDVVVEDSSIPFDENVPSKIPKMWFPISSIGINIGLIYSF